MTSPDPGPVTGPSNSWRDLTRVDTRRSFAIMAAGAVVGLLLAGYALFTARGTSTLVVPAEDVALVNQQPVSRVDFLLQLQTLYGVDLEHSTHEQRQKILDDMIREELFVQRGKELDLSSSDPEVRNALVNAVEVEISENAITTQPSEEALRTYYDRHQQKYSSEGIMTVRDLVFPADEAQELPERLKQLSGPATPALLAQLHARNTGKTSDEEFYFAAKIHLGEQLFEAARPLPDGGMSAPITLPDGVHVLYMEKNTRPVPFDFAKAHARVLDDYRNEAISHLRAGDEIFLRKRANVLIADDMH